MVFFKIWYFQIVKVFLFKYKRMMNQKIIYENGGIEYDS